jgi:hypothetical protein
MRALRQYGLERAPNYTELLYERDFPDFFIDHAKRWEYQWDWTRILMDLRNGSFLYYQNTYNRTSITGKPLAQSDARALGEWLIHRLAAFATILPTGEAVMRSLQLDGFDVDKDNLALVPLEGPVSAQEEEDRLSALIKDSGIPNAGTVLTHVSDAHSLYIGEKYHSSLNESRSFIQGLIDEISVETDKHGTHSTGLPGGTANRMDYLLRVGFLTQDEKTALQSAWGSLSAGSHPGVPEREQARIGMVLGLEFGQLLMMKFGNWKSNSYRTFS